MVGEEIVVFVLLHLSQCNQNILFRLHAEEVVVCQSSRKEPSSVGFRC